MEGAVPKYQRSQNEIMGRAGPVTAGVAVKKEDKVIEAVDMMQSSASHVLSPQVVEPTGKER